jgi:soluble lytic murein transglycosylase
MTPPTATATRRPAASPRSGAVRRQAVARRRRRRALSVVVLGAVIVLGILALPLARKAVNELGLPLRYQDVIRQQAAQKHLDPALIAAVIYAETKFDPRPSSAGAQGLMQLMPQTALFLAHRSGATTFRVSDLGRPDVNIAYGSYYLRYLLDEYHGHLITALAAYNGGESNVNQWIANARADGRTMTIDDIPFAETRAYVRNVLQKQQDYRNTYSAELGY